MNEALLRQRRNVFISCAVLWVLSLGGVDIQELTLAGMKFGAFRNPHVFLFMIWIAFAYFVYRYFLYFVEFAIENLTQTWTREFERTVNPRIERLVKAEFTTHNGPTNHYSYHFLRQNKFTWRGQIRWTDSANLSDISLPIPRWAILPWELKGFLRFCIITPVLTDYVLPFIFAAATIIYCGMMVSWIGNLSTLFF